MRANKKYMAAALGAGAVVFGVLSYVTVSKADGMPPAQPGPIDGALVELGIQIAPVPLNMDGKDRAKVGYGSYLVNAIGGCNDCHTNPSYSDDGNPYMGMPTKINAAGYLAGGAAFGPFISRNITPDATGQVAGGYSNFVQIIRHGTDLEHQHPEISPLLQVMPWPLYANMTDRELGAIYEYLTTIPCLEGGPGALPNRCQPQAMTQAVALPKGATTIQSQYQLDGTQSTSADGKALKYQWTIPAGYPQAGISQGDTATPTVQFALGKGTYAFDLTVTDSTGKTSTDRATVNYAGQ